MNSILVHCNFGLALQSPRRLKKYDWGVNFVERKAAAARRGENSRWSDTNGSEHSVAAQDKDLFTIIYALPDSVQKLPKRS